MTRGGLICLGLLGALGATAILADALGEPFLVTLATRAAILALAGTGLNLALGAGGLVSFGHAAFFGVGGYAVGVLASHAQDGLPLFGGAAVPLLGVLEGSDTMPLLWLVALLVSGLAGLLIGALSLRTGGVYFIMITLAFSQMLYQFAVGWQRYGGEDGLTIYVRNGFPGVNTLDPLGFFALVFALLALTLLVYAVIERSAFGLALNAAREVPERVRALGANVYRLRLVAFTVSAMMTGLAGALFADLNRFVSPTMLGWQTSGEIMVFVILGGVGRLGGPLAGAAAFVALEHLLGDLPGGAGEHWHVWLGLLLLLVVLFARGGIVGTLEDRLPRRTRPEAGRTDTGRRPEHGDVKSARVDRPVFPDAGVQTASDGRIDVQATTGTTTGPAVLSTEALTKSFGALRASDAVSLDVRRGEVHALIGPNGAGKSTLIALIAGSLAPDGGRVRLLDEEVTGLDVAARARRGLGRSFQVSAVVPALDVTENVALALLVRERRPFRDPGAWRRRATLMRRAREHAARTGLAEREGVPAADLSHGERRRLELAMVLALEPALFLLDEPLAGLGPEGAAAMIELLAELRQEAPILLVEHDMDAVFALADRVSVLVYGRVIASGPVAAIRADPAVREAYLGTDETRSEGRGPDPTRNPSSASSPGLSASPYPAPPSAPSSGATPDGPPTRS